MTEAMRWNRHKTRLSLICPHFAEDLARQLGVGENRYGAGNWKKGLQISEVLDSLKRHTAALERGEEVDPDTGLHHSVAITSNAMFLHYYHRTGQQDTLDDRHTNTDWVKCRQCGTSQPRTNYAPSRLAKSDFQCNKCKNQERSRMRSRMRKSASL